jgi:hypothetical protein
MLMLMALSMIIAVCGAPGTATPDKAAIGAVVPLTGRYAAGGEQIL